MEKEPMTNYGGREAGRIDWVDSLFTYGMVLVVLGHVILTDADSSTYLSHWIYGFHMPLFFWLAGVLFKNDTSIGKFALKKPGDFLYLWLCLHASRTSPNITLLISLSILSVRTIMSLSVF